MKKLVMNDDFDIDKEFEWYMVIYHDGHDGEIKRRIL